MFPHWQVSVYMVTTLASICQYCNHIGERLSILSQHWQVCQQCGVKTSICQYCYHITFSKCMSILLPHWQVFFSTVTTLASACLYCYHNGKCISVVCTVYTLAHICQCYKYYHIGKYLSILLPLYLVFDSTVGKCLSILLLVTTLASIYQYCYHIGKYILVLLQHKQI